MIEIDSLRRQKIFFFSHDEINGFPIEGNKNQILDHMRKKDGIMLYIDSIIEIDSTHPDLINQVGDMTHLKGIFVAHTQNKDEDADTLIQKLQLYPTMCSQIGDTIFGSDLMYNPNFSDKRIHQTSHFLELSTKGLESLKSYFIETCDDNKQEELKKNDFANEKACDKLISIAPRYHTEDTIIDCCNELLRSSTTIAVINSISSLKKEQYLKNTNFFIKELNEIWVSLDRLFDYGDNHTDSNFPDLIAYIENKKLIKRKVKLNHIFEPDNKSIKSESMISGMFHFQLFPEENFVIKFIPHENCIINGEELNHEIYMAFDDIRSFAARNSLHNRFFKFCGGVNRAKDLIQTKSKYLGRIFLWTIGHQTGVLLHEFFSVISEQKIEFDQDLYKTLKNDLTDLGIDIEELMQSQDSTINSKIDDKLNSTNKKQVINSRIIKKLLSVVDKRNECSYVTNHNYRVIKAYCNHMLENNFEINEPMAPTKFVEYMKKNNLYPIESVTGKNIKYKDGESKTKDAFKQSIRRMLTK